MKHKQVAEARRLLLALGFSVPERGIRSIQASLQNRDFAQRSIFHREYAKALMIALEFGLFNQLSGINAILYYANDIFTRAGYGSASAGKQAVALGLTNLLFTALGMSLIDSLGRKPLLVAGAAGMAAALAGISGILTSKAISISCSLCFFCLSLPSLRCRAWWCGFTSVRSSRAPFAKAGNAAPAFGFGCLRR